MPDIIIHGASSFLGKHLAKRLIADGAHFTILARKKSDILYAENKIGIKIIKYQNTLDEIPANAIQIKDAIFIEFSWHGVFGTERNIAEQLSVNIPLIISSIELAHRLNSKQWIGFGSQAEYGNLDKKISESDICNPTTLYGKSKYFCSQISKELCKVYGINHSWLRLFSVFGPDDNHEWLIQYLIKKMLANEDIDVTKGDQLWDYLYVEDIIDLLLKLIHTNGCGVANLGSGKSVSVKHIINLIKQITLADSTINFGAIPYRSDQVMNMEADITQLQSVVDWDPKTSLIEGLQKTIFFIKSKDQI